MDRLGFHELLKTISGLNSVYFQPPPNIKMVYPCIIYKLSNEDMKRANNKLYLKKKQYAVTIVDKDPDSVIPDKVSELPLTSFATRFTADNLNHTVYNIYY